MEVAVLADHPADRADVRQQAQALADLLAASANRSELLVVVGKLEEDALDLVVDRRREQAERLGRRLLGREVRVGRVAAEERVHVPRHLAEAAEALQELVVARGHRVERELPAVLPVRDEALENPEGRVHRAAVVRVPAGQLRDVLEAALRQEPQQLELGVDPRLEPAEDLQDQLLVEDDGRVRLLGRDLPRVAKLGRKPGVSLDLRELDRPLPGLDLRARAHHANELSRLARVGERIEAVAGEQLVRLVRSGVEADLDELELEHRIGGTQGRTVDDRRMRRRRASSSRTSAGS